MEEKYCTNCEETKPIAEFYKDRRTKDGYVSQCKQCKKLHQRIYANTHKEERKAYRKKYWKENSEKLSSKNKLYYKSNKENILEQKKKYYAQLKTKIRKSQKEYYLSNRASIQKKQRTYERERRKKDSNFRLRLSLRKRLYQAIKGQYKAGSAVKDLGCSIEYLKVFLEAKFFDGMTWKNYGAWHIDHIVPLASFDLANREQFLKACHYTNLQPLWAEDNITKGHALSGDAKVGRDFVVRAKSEE